MKSLVEEKTLKDKRWNKIINNFLNDYKDEPQDEFLEWAESIKVKEGELKRH